MSVDEGEMGVKMKRLISVWAFYGGQIEKLEKINPEFDGMSRHWFGSLYQFGKVQHYFVTLVGDVKLAGTGQYKFCFEDGSVREIGDDTFFRVLMAGVR